MPVSKPEGLKQEIEGLSRTEFDLLATRLQWTFGDHWRSEAPHPPNSGYLFRVSKLSDHGSVSALLTACYGTIFAQYYDPGLLSAALPLVTEAKPELLASGTFYVAEFADKVLACGGWSPSGPVNGSTGRAIAHVRHFATHPRYLRRGLAATILRRCVQEARHAGFAQLEALSSLAAERFYAAASFSFVEKVDLQLPGDFLMPAVRMRRAL